MKVENNDESRFDGHPAKKEEDPTRKRLFDSGKKSKRSQTKLKF